MASKATTDGARIVMRGLGFASSPTWFTVWDGKPGKSNIVYGPERLRRPVNDADTLARVARDWFATEKFNRDLEAMA